MIRIVIKKNQRFINEKKKEKIKSINNFVYHQIHCILRSINWTHLMDVCFVLLCCVVLVFFVTLNRIFSFRKHYVTIQSYTHTHTCICVFDLKKEIKVTDMTTDCPVDNLDCKSHDNFLR